MILKQVKFITASNNIKINNMKKKSSFKMKGNPMQRNFGIGDSPMHIGGLVRKAAKKVMSKLSSKTPRTTKTIDMADIPRKANPKRVKDIPNIKAIDAKTGKTVAPKDFDPTKAYKYKTAKDQIAKSKVTGRKKYSYHDYNKDVKGRIRQ